VPESRDRTAPAECDEELRRRLRLHARTRALADGRLTAIDGGLSNRAWRVDLGGETWFARLGPPDAALLGADRESECRLLVAVSDAGIAPAVFECDPARGLLVTRFVDGRTWRREDALQPENLRKIGRAFTELHALPVPAGVREISFQRQAYRLGSMLPGGDRLATELAQRAARAWERMAGSARVHVLCHNDVHHLNVLDDGARVWLVDWEYGGRGDPLMDVAGFLAMHEAGPGETSVLMSAYEGPGRADPAVLDVARWLFDYVQWLWYRSRFAAGPGPAEEVSERLARRLVRCNNPGLERGSG
jgi:thiamine kinase